MAQQPPHVRGVVAHPGEAPDDLCDAVKGPQVGVEAVGLGALQQRLFCLRKLGVGHPGGPARCAAACKARGAIGLEARMPAAGGLAGDAQPAGDFGLVDALGEQVGGLQAAVLEGVAVPAVGGRFAITGSHGLMLPPRPSVVTLDRKDL
jgi:hypothetical protein